jgi:hypothetical protein
MQYISQYDMFLELDFLVILVNNKQTHFAYVPNAGLYHHHVSSISELLRKRKYNATKIYLGNIHRKEYLWFDPKKDALKIVFWIVYANVFFPSLFVGIYKSIRYKDWAGMYEPIVNLLVTDLVVISFLRTEKGRNLARGIYQK